MASSPNTNAIDDFGRKRMLSALYPDHTQTHVSAVSWNAIFAGAAAAAALSLILVILGTGLGLSSVSPWAHEGISASAIGISGHINVWTQRSRY